MFSLGGRLSTRLLLGCVAAFLFGIPFTVLLSLVDTKWGPLWHLDNDTTRAFNRYVLHHRAYVNPLRATSYIFHAWVFRVVVIGLAAWLFYRGARRLAAWAITTIIAGGALDLVLKVLVNRPRPKLPSAIAHAPGGSFPSGHSLTAALGSAVIVLILLPLMRPVWRVVAWVLAAVMTIAAGLCRVALGVHYLSDVFAGWILGVGIVIATVAAFETWRRDVGRPPVHPATEGIEPEAAPTIAPSGDGAPAKSGL